MMLKIVATGVLLFMAGLSIFAQDERSEEVIKVETALVGVPVAVSDRDGRYVPNLRVEDFTLYVDGKQQKIEFFAQSEEALNVALLIDTSRSTQDVLGEIKDAAQDFIRLLKPQDKAMIVSFDYEPHVLSALTDDREQLKRAVKRAEIGEYVGTALNDAIDETNRTFSKIKGRKAIIVLTDGKDAGSQQTADDLLYTLEESDAPVYTVFYKTGGSRFSDTRDGIMFPRGGRGGRGGMGRGGVFGGRFPNGGGRSGRNTERRRERVEQKNAEAEDFLQQIAEETGGRSFSGEVGDLKKTFASIADELRFQYRLGFYPPENQTNETGEAAHALKVKVARTGAVVRTRSGYRVQNH